LKAILTTFVKIACSKAMKTFTFFILILFIRIGGQSQSLVNTTGNTIVSNSYQIEYSVGEISITTLAGSSNFITQGLLQPTLKVINPDCQIINEPLQNFPNPTRDKLRLVGQFDWITGYHIYAADGKLVRVASFINNYIDISNLPAATYFIKLYPACDNKYKVLKVVKQ
jgi:hypothetical protein